MFKYLDYIKAVDEYGSFTLAAEGLCISQPALSIAIRKAEEELGVTLFDRNRKPVRLTEQGRAYLNAANRAALIEKQMIDSLKENSKITGHIKIGAAGISMTYLVPEILDVYSAEYPEVQVEVIEESLYTLKDQLRRDEIDLIVDTEGDDTDIVSERLFQNHVLYAVPEHLIRDEALLSRGMTAEEVNRNDISSFPAVRMQDLLDIPYLSMQPRNEIYRRAEWYFSYYQCRPRTIMRFNQQLTGYNFAQRGYGAAFVSDTLVHYYPVEGVRFYRFDCPMPERWIAVGYRKGSYLTQAAQAFIATAKSMQMA